MKKLLFLTLILANFSFIPQDKNNREKDYTCTVRVVVDGEVKIVTADSDASYKDACQKAYAQAMLQ